MNALPASPRLSFRALTAADAEGPYLRWMNDPAITADLVSGERVFSADDLRSYIAAANADPAVHLYAMVTLDGRHIGNIKLVASADGSGDLGLLIGEKGEWGKGYAREAISAMTAHGFAVLGLTKVVAGCYSTNLGSIKAFIAAGYTRCRHLPRYQRAGDGWRDAWLLERQKPE